jgi:hypothetical protein
MSRNGYSAVKVEVYFDLSALDSDGFFIIGSSTIGGTDTIAGEVATDITPYCYAVSTSRGRNRELDTVTTGVATVRLRNYDGRFLPEEFNAASPYVGEIFPGKRVRISFDATGEPIFAGRIDEFNYSYSVDGEVDASFEVIDALGQLASMSFNAWTSTAGQTSGERVTAVLDRSEIDWGPARSIGTGVVTLQSDSVTWGSNVKNYIDLLTATERGFFFADRGDTLVFKGRDELALAATTFAAEPNENSRHLVVGGFTSTTPTNLMTGSFSGADYTVRPDSWTETLSFLIDDLSSNVNIVGSSNGHAGVQVFSNGQVIVFQFDEDSNPFRVYSDFPEVVEGTRYWLRSTIDFTDPDASTLELSTNGVTFYSIGNYRDGDASKGVLSLARLSDYQVGFTRTTGTETMGATRIYSWSRSYVNPTDGDRSVSFTSDDVLTLPLGVLTTDDTPSLGSTNLTVYDGTVQVAGDQFDLTYRDILSDDDKGIPFTALELASSSELLFNRVGVDRENGALQTVSATTSQNAYGVRSLQLVGLLMETDDQALSLARYLLDQYSDPQPRIAAITVIADVLDPASQLDSRVGVHDLGDIVEVRWTPVGSSTQVTQLSLVEGKAHNVTVDGLHTIRYALSPADNLSGFIIGDAKFGVIGTSKIAF